MMTESRLSFVIPARNEEALIGEVLEAILASVARASGVSRHELWLPDTSFEVVVADDGSEDATAAIVGNFGDATCVRLVPCIGRTCAAARNSGASASSGRFLCFVVADTILPEKEVDRILQLFYDPDAVEELPPVVTAQPSAGTGMSAQDATTSALRRAETTPAVPALPPPAEAVVFSS